MLPQTPADWAQLYTQLGCAPIPLPPKAKKPVIAAWQQLKIPANDIPRYFDTADSNIGVVLGELSGGLTDIDLDVAEAVEAARLLLPETRIFGRQSRPASHYLYKCMDANTRKFQYDGTMLVEIRSSGTQTMMPGSIHPDGQLVRFENNHKLIEIPFDQLQCQVGQVAAAALLARLLAGMNGTRHETYLVAAGAFLHGGMQPDAVELFMRAVLAASGDEEAADRLHAVKDSIKNHSKGKSVSGWPTLAKLLPAVAIEKLREWLDIQDMPRLKINGQEITGRKLADFAALAWQAPPQPLSREVPPAENFPLDALGEVLTPMAQAMQEIIQAPAALCGQSVLAAVAQVVQAHCDVVINGRVCPISLYILSIGRTGERKSAVDNEALSPHRKFQRDRMEAYREEFRTYLADKAALEKMQEQVLRDRGNYPDRDAKKAALLALGPPPVQPIKPLLLVADPTFEGLIKYFDYGWPSVGLFSDEGGRFVGGYGMSADNQLKTASGLSDLWGGKPIDRVRSGDGVALLYGRRLSMHLMAQPVVSGQLFSNQLLMGQGMLSRLLVAYPESTIGDRLYREESLCDRPEQVRYFARMMDLLEQPLPLAEGTSNVLQPRAVPLAMDAMRTWVAYHDHIEVQCKPGGELHPVAGVAAKAAEQAARIATVLALVDDIHAGEVSQPYIEAGIALSEFYVTEALRLFDLAPLDAALENAGKLLVWAQNHEATRWPIQALYQKGPRCIRSKKAAIDALELLENHGWVRSIDNEWEFRK